MADLVLAARSPLAGVATTAPDMQTAPGVTLAEQPAGTQFTVLARRGQAAALAERLGGHGVVLPLTPGRTESRGVAVIATAPGQWLVMCGAGDGERARRLFAAFTSLCTLVDTDDGRIVVSVTGPRAIETLAKILAIDLHPRAFRVGDAAVTVAGGIAVVVWQAEAGRFDCAVPRSLARSFWDWLAGSAAEYGYAVGRLP